MCRTITTREDLSRRTDSAVPHKSKASPLMAMRLFYIGSLPAYTLNEDPQPQVLFTFGFSNLKPAPSRVST
jgi:hypothetical protein